MPSPLYSSEQSIITYLTDNWDHTVVDIDNSGFDSKDVDEFIRITVTHENNEQMSLGGEPRHYKFRGMITIQIFTPLNIGRGRVLELADYLVNMFILTTIDQRVICDVPDLVHIGPTSGMYQANLTCPFHHDELI